MKISYNWLRRYINTTLSPHEISVALTTIGLEVEHEEEIESIRGGLRGLVVGEVMECVQHPNADKLHCTQVNIGGGVMLPIVCGAPNVAKGQKVAVATIGTVLYDHEGNSFTIKKSKLRGEPSEGMLCAEDEIGLGTGHDGILVLPEDCPVGTPLENVYPVERDTIFEIGLTANRADAMSHYGVARDLAAYLNLSAPCKASLPEVHRYPFSPSPTALQLGDIDAERCIRYCGLTIRKVQVSQSPAWLQKLLTSIGVRPINNVVDITNYILHETGNPLHAFDLRAFQTGKVSVHTVDAGTPFTTLDEKERKLEITDLCICDGEKPLCLAGVFGGLTSGVTESTTDIFLEAAVFDPVTIRRTARFHGLNTDASFRFERGVDPQFTRYTLLRAAQLIVELANGTIDGEPLDFYPTPCLPHHVTFDVARAKRLLGYDIDNKKLEKILEGLEIVRTNKGDGVWELEVPYYRIDVTREADIVEEILRLGGFPPLGENRIAFSLDSRNDYRRPRLEKTTDWLVGAGFQEIMTLSLVRGEDAKICIPEAQLIPLLNPLSSDLDTLRPNLLLGALDTVARNVARQQENLRLFEVGNVFLRDDNGGKRTEKAKLSLVLTGELESASWLGSARSASLFELKGYLEAVLTAFSFPLHTLDYIAEGTNPEIYAEAVQVVYQGHTLGTLGLVAPKFCKRFGIKIPVYYAELDCETLEAYYKNQRVEITPPSRFPEVRRDLSLLVQHSVRFSALRDLAFRTAPKLVHDVALFDVYEGKGVPEGMKSYAISFILQSTEKTLTDADIDGCMNKLIKRYKEELNAELRS